MTPNADVELNEALIRSLLAQQFPEAAGEPLTFAATGWDNEMWRLGERRAVRLPRRASAVRALEAEHRWAAETGWGLSLPVPEPTFLGEPQGLYPYPWLVTTWFPGVNAATLAPPQRDAYAEQLAGFLVGFHRLAPLDAPENAVRGAAVEDRWAAWQGALDTVPAAVRGALAEEMDRARGAVPWTAPARWIHGDPHAGNLVAVVRGGSEARLSAVVDLSDLTSGDPASDLGIAQAQFSAEGARRFRAAYGRGAFWADAELWDRAAGWRAHFLALMHDDGGELGAVARQGLGLA